MGKFPEKVFRILLGDFFQSQISGFRCSVLEAFALLGC
jgi:hypothetical protein